MARHAELYLRAGAGDFVVRGWFPARGEFPRSIELAFDGRALEHPYWKDTLPFLSGERYDVLVPIHGKKDAVCMSCGLGKGLSIMHDQATRMSRLINDLLSLSRIELNEHVRPSGSINLGDVIEEVTNALTPVADAGHMTIDLVEPMSLPNVAGDREELIQMFTNLIDNAIKYGKPGMPITVELGTRRAVAGEAGPSPAVYVAVKDHGEGIAREHIPRLTERFYRVDPGRSRSTGGSGLGLAIVKHVLQRHGASLEVESRQGEGSTFTCHFPPTRVVRETRPADAATA